MTKKWASLPEFIKAVRETNNGIVDERLAEIAGANREYYAALATVYILRDQGYTDAEIYEIIKDSVEITRDDENG